MYKREGSFAERGSFAPVKVGDIVEVKIEAVGEKGDGIAKKDGFVLFVPNTQEGQTVKIRVTKVLRKVGFAEVAGEGQPAAAEQPAEESHESSEEPSSEEPQEAEQDAEDTEDFGEESQEEKY